MYSNLMNKIVSDLNVAESVVQKYIDLPIVSVFGSARVPESHHFYKDTFNIGKGLAEAGFAVCTGGGPGLMDAASKGAKAGKGKTLGLSIVLPHEQKPNSHLDDNITFANFAQRKIVFASISNAFVVVPGGFGSLDELFEVLTLIQCKILKRIPVVLYNKEYWEPMMCFIEKSLLAENMIHPSDISLVRMANSVEEVVDIVKHSCPLV